MYLTQIRSKAATGINWLSLFAGAAINTIARFQKQPFLQTSKICVIYILPNRNDYLHSGNSGGFVRFWLDGFEIHSPSHCLAMLVGQMPINLSNQHATVFVSHPGGYCHEINATHDAH
jgi:hypothetical protein